MNESGDELATEEARPPTSLVRPPNAGPRAAGAAPSSSTTTANNHNHNHNHNPTALAAAASTQNVAPPASAAPLSNGKRCRMFIELEQCYDGVRRSRLGREPARSNTIAPCAPRGFPRPRGFRHRTPRAAPFLSATLSPSPCCHARPSCRLLLPVRPGVGGDAPLELGV